jgi:hypothetical protein
MATTVESSKNMNTILNDYSIRVILNEYDNLYAKYNLQKTTNKQTPINYDEIDELINNINNSNTSNISNQKFRERKCYPTSNLVYATKELHDVIMNPKFSSYLHCHGSHDMSKSFDIKILLYGLKYFDIHYLDKKITNPILLNELVEIQNTFRSQKKEKIDNFIKKWTVKDRDIQINL